MAAEDTSKVQEEFAKAVTDSATRLASAWKDAIQRATGALPSGASPLPVPDIADRTSAGLREIISTAGKDLPELVRAMENPSVRDRITEKWLETYKSAVRESLGIPPPSETEQAISQWKRTIREFSAQGQGASFGMPAHPFPWIDAFFPLKRPDTPKDVLGFWFRSYEWMLGTLTPIHRPLTAGDYPKRAIQAIDAQIRYMSGLPAVNELMAHACEQAIARVVDTLRASRSRELSDDVYSLFHKTWISANEQVFTALLKSDDFGSTLARMIREGLEAKNRLESVMTELLSHFDVPRRKEFDQALRTISTLEERMGRLEQELDALKKTTQDR